MFYQPVGITLQLSNTTIHTVKYDNSNQMRLVLPTIMVFELEDFHTKGMSAYFCWLSTSLTFLVITKLVTFLLL